MIRRPHRRRRPLSLAGSLLTVLAVAGCVPASADSLAPATSAGSSAQATSTPALTSTTNATTTPPATTATTRTPTTTGQGATAAPRTRHTSSSRTPTAAATVRPGAAVTTLATLRVKGRAARTGYARELFGQAWADVDRNGCDTRNDILRRDLRDTSLKPGTQGCVVLTGTLSDPYTGTRIAFVRGRGTSSAVQVDHVVALSDAWQKGAQRWSTAVRTRFANDPLNLLAVDGPTNQRKGDGDAATWLPPDRRVRCGYVARQIAVKHRYALSVTPAERDAMVRVLTTCPAQALPR